MATTETALGLRVTTEPLEPMPLDVGALLAKAVEANVPIETLERLVALRERLHAEQARQAFFVALSAFQGACPVIPKTKTATIASARGSYKYSFAPLDVIVRHVGAILEAHGLSVTFNTAIVEGSLLVSTCTVHHVGGHHESSDFRVPIDAEARMNDAQKVASASTYAKRYAYCNALGILTGDEDDDAGALGGGATKTPFTPPRKLGDKALAERGFNRADPDAAREQGSAAGPTESGPPTAPAQPVVGPCTPDYITPPQVKRIHSIMRLATKGNDAAAKLARAQLYLQLTKHAGVVIEKFEHIPKTATETYRLLCDEWIDKAAAWAIRHVDKKS